jgi:hypothetical protein
MPPGARVVTSEQQIGHGEVRWIEVGDALDGSPEIVGEEPGPPTGLEPVENPEGIGAPGPYGLGRAEADDGGVAVANDGEIGGRGQPCEQPVQG